MSVFGKYSGYYDLLYKDKNYPVETDFVDLLIKRFNPPGRRLLELGCGSGGHAFELAQRGYSVHGIDLSLDMLNIAKQRQAADQSGGVEFSQGDIRAFQLGKRFDCVISLFHVISYLPTLTDIRDCLLQVNRHLEPGGTFIFDVWYGPAVLTVKPAVRIKRMQNDTIAVTRIAEPVWHPNECWIDVRYKVFIRDLRTGQINELEAEVHRMRYLSIPEISLLADLCNFQVLHICEWQTNNPPSENTWGVCFVLQKTAEAP